ncbi:acyl-CoA dehydrogenase family protein [Plantactinospora sp. WMMB782]|uniref:acyl-CoA dehydrogenase family protein n=1 Tax=Plantactinospora sp. WMMB782 TaxID=3404121 RepID=UPI003B9535CC
MATARQRDRAVTGHEEFRRQVRAWLAGNVPADGLPDPDTDAGFRAHRDWERRLYDAGYSGISWPVEYGGRGGDVLHEAIFAEEYERAAGPVRITRPVQRFLGPTLIHYGSAEQHHSWLPAMLRADDIWCQGFSEPDAGSDLAGVRTRARCDGTRYVVDGQKTWTTYGRFADWMFTLVRTGEPGGRHRGLSCLVIDLHSPGVRVRPVRQLHGQTGFAEVFFDSVAVPAGNLVGPRDEGWRVALTLLSFERGPDAGAPERTRRRLDALAGDVREAGAAPGVVRELGDGYARLAALRAYVHRRVGTRLHGEPVGAESSLVKLFSARLDTDIVQLGVDLFGDERLAERAPEFLDYWHSRAGSVYGGTTEIQRNVVADRILGLPR